MLTQNFTVCSPYAALSVLSSARVVTATRGGSIGSMLSQHQRYLQRVKIINPSLLMMTDIQDESAPSDHDCVMLSHTQPSSISEIPLENPDIILFTDGSAQVVN